MIVQVKEGWGGETLAKSYTANALNQYTAIANPDAVGLRGSATNTATVSVNGSAALSDNVASSVVPWHYALQADNANSPDYTFANIMAVVNPPGTNTPDIVSTASGHIYAPPQNEALTYDDDGNLLSDGRWHYAWNGENRLVCAEEQVCPTNRTLRKVDYAYDHQGRMVWKAVLHRATEAQSWEEEKATSYLWDGFNIIAESIHHSSFSNHNFYIWGLDIDSTLQGAGGVGGLLAVVKDSATYVSVYDANGNIMEYVSADGTIVAHREYDPFGGTVVYAGNANAFTHWFSTKPWCTATGLSEYQYRKYSPVMGRWMSKDPIEEKGGHNRHAFVLNNPIVSNSSVACVGDISLAIGGAQTKGLKKDLRYRPIKVVFVGGATEPVLTSHQDPSFDEFTVGIESIAGQQIMAFVQKQKPWEWASLESIPFSNHLLLAGDVKEMRWQYSSVYPDEKLASFIQALRIMLLLESDEFSCCS